VSDDITLIEQRTTELRNEIIAGKYGKAGNGRIPTSRDLSVRWNTPRSTVYQILQLLQSEGIIRSKGKYLVVNWPSLDLQGLTKNFEQFLRDRGHEAIIENLIIPELVDMPADIAAIFGQAEAVHVIHRMRGQGIAGQPLRIAENWYPARLAGQFLEEMRTHDHMDVIGAIDRVHGLHIVESEDVLLARVPTAQEARTLDIVRTEPIVEIRRSNFAQDGTPLMWNRIIHVGPHFKFSYRYKVDFWKK
jgi:GntR family transcriptional regulator